MNEYRIVVTIENGLRSTESVVDDLVVMSNLTGSEAREMFDAVGETLRAEFDDTHALQMPTE